MLKCVHLFHKISEKREKSEVKMATQLSTYIGIAIVMVSPLTCGIRLKPVFTIDSEIIFAACLKKIDKNINHHDTRNEKDRIE